MKPSKLLSLLAALLCAVATQAALAGANASTGAEPGAAAQCDSVSFASGTPANRAACRRIFARQIRPTLQTSPLTASDYGS